MSPAADPAESWPDRKIGVPQDPHISQYHWLIPMAGRDSRFPSLWIAEDQEFFVECVTSQDAMTYFERGSWTYGGPCYDKQDLIDHIDFLNASAAS